VTSKVPKPGRLRAREGIRSFQTWKKCGLVDVVDLCTAALFT